MEMHQLRYVAAVARSGNFSRAAEECNVSQPSLSQQILKLEEELGERLFERTRREARPTPHGERFLRRALRILGEVDAARREAEEARHLLSGTVILGAIPTVAPYLLPRVLQSYARRFPGVEIIVREETTARLIKALHAREVELALLSLPFPSERLEIRQVLTEELLLALPPGHRLEGKRKVGPSDLRGERLIILEEEHCLGDQVLGFYNRGGAPAAVSFRSAQLETLRSLVHAGMGLSLIPEMGVREARKGEPLCRSLAGRPTRTVAAAWNARRPLSRAASELMTEILKHPQKSR